LRDITDYTIRKTCEEFAWFIHAIEVRSNHVHIVVTAKDASPGKTMGLLKARCSGVLNKTNGGAQKWWTKDGSKRVLWTKDSFDRAIRYVMDHERKGHGTNSSEQHP